MPYIKKERRVELIQYDATGMYIRTRDMTSSGELNFAITSLVLDYVNGIRPLSYSSINDAIGALECAKLELYRRLASPYEDKKIKENGDVY
jgi:hypothetical protein